MSLAEAVLADVTRELTERGRVVQMMYGEQRYYDPRTGGYTPASHDRLGERSVGVPMNYQRDAVDGQTVLKTDIQFVVAAASLTRRPEAGDKMVVEPDGVAEIYNVVSARPQEMDGVVLAHLLQLRSVSG